MKPSFRRAAALAAVAAGCAALSAPSVQAQQFTVTNLVSDGFVPAVTVDPSLINPWGISYAPGNPFWISDNGTGVTTLYDGTGAKIPLTVTIPPPPGGAGPSTPTGQVFNGSPHGFKVGNGTKTGNALFLFATEDGTIAGWAPSVDFLNAFIAVDASARNAVYKGLAIGVKGAGTFLYAANFRNGVVEMYNAKFQMIKSFTDPTVKAGYAPFNVQNLGGTLYVTFALRDADKHDDVAGPHHGYVDAFTLDGRFLRRVVTGGALNSPWGLDIAPPSFGALAGALLVGNFGDGWINAYDPNTGAYKGALTGTDGYPIVLGDLWALTNGGGGKDGDPNTVYFTAAIQDEAHGLFGAISPSAPGAKSAK